MTAKANKRELSTPTPFKAVRAHIEADQLKWWRCNSQLTLEPPSEPSGVVSDDTAAGALVWLRGPDQKLVPCVRFIPGEFYDPNEAREQALKKRSAELSPHSTFRGIVNAFQVIEFLRDFGPIDKVSPAILTDQLEGREPAYFVNLDDFLKRQRLYRAIVQLWEGFSNAEQLRQGWANLIKSKDSPFRPEWRWFFKDWVIRDDPDPEETWRESGEPATLDWLKSPDRELREQTAGLIAKKVKENTTGQLGWDFGWSASGVPTFTPRPLVTSLWSLMWEFFARDTVGEVSWRICPHCGKVFNPPRKDRFFCRPIFQQLYSKRSWARARRASQHRSKPARSKKTKA